MSPNANVQNAYYENVQTAMQFHYLIYRSALPSGLTSNTCIMACPSATLDLSRRNRLYIRARISVQYHCEIPFLPLSLRVQAGLEARLEEFHPVYGLSS